MKIRRQAKASSLIITLLVLVVLSTIVVAFMQSMSIERMTAKSVANTYQAQLAAEAGLAAALQKIKAAATTNCVVAYDNQIADPSLRPLTFIPLDSRGIPTATNSVALTNAEVLAGTNHAFQLGADTIKRANLYILLNSAGKTNGVYSYVVQDNGAKQNLLRYPNLSYRAYGTTLREVPLIGDSGTTMPIVASNTINALAQVNVNWVSNLLTPATFNQAVGTNLGVSEKWADTANWSRLMDRQGGPKLNLRRLKFYLDSLGNGQGATFALNPKSAVVEALLDRPSNVDPVAAWGGGTLQWLLSENEGNSGNYTLTEARQIAANLIDYLDADLHATTDNANAPTYLGVEGRLESDGTITGHPYVSALGFGLIFNISGAGGSDLSKLNSTRVLLFWALVNPWSHETLTLNSSYTPEFDIEIQGQVTGGGSLGSDAKNYFLLTLNERLTEGPTKLGKNRGNVFPISPSANSFANFYDINNGPGRQPANMTFSNMKFVIRKIRLKFRSTDNTQSYVQILDGLNSKTVDMNPATFTLPSATPGNGFAVNYNPGNTKKGLFLNNDPRLNFMASSWIPGTITSDTYSTNPPVSSPTVNVFGSMHATEGDGLQGMLADSTWYAQPATTNHFFVRSPQIMADPKTTVYNPQNTPTNLAVDSIAELGYLHTGRPWQTLNILNKIESAARLDYNLLDYVDADTMPSTNSGGVGAISRVNGKINPNTASPQTLRGIFTGLPNVSEANIRTFIDEIATNALATTNYPYIGSANYGALVPLARGIANKFQREDIMRRMVNMTTTHSDNFTIYSYGEARQGSKTVGRANLAAVVELGQDATGNVTVKVVRRSWK